VISKLKITPSKFPGAKAGGSTAGASGAAVTYSLNVTASVRFTATQMVNGRAVHGKCVASTRSTRRKPPCTSTKSVSGSFVVAGSAGRNSFRFTGRIGGRALMPGKYVLIATPTDAAHRSGPAVTAKFRIVR
jgi:hypothetical protein